MLIKLFDISNGKVIPTEHCYTLKFLKVIIDKYPDTYLEVFQYLFYMTCPDPDINPFFSSKIEGIFSHSFPVSLLISRLGQISAPSLGCNI